MLILLPPSETKTGRARGNTTDLDKLSFPELTETRRRVQAALSEVSAHDDAADRLGISPNLVSEIARNRELATAPAQLVRNLYSGVLYDALDLPTLEATALRRANKRIVVQSALYGALRLTDKVSPYRLSMAVNLSPLGPVSSLWRQQLETVMRPAAGHGLVVDCRSSTYASAWTPSGEVAHRWIQIKVPGATHMAKHTRGLVTRALVQQAADPRRPEALRQLLSDEFETNLIAPTRAGAPWILETIAR